MRSMMQILCAVKDGEIIDHEAAALILNEESAEYSKALNISETAARAHLLDNIAEVANRLYPSSEAAYLVDLFSLTPKENDGNERDDNNSDAT